MFVRELLKRVLPPRVKNALKQIGKQAGARYKDARKRLARPNLYRMNAPERIGVVYTAPSEMSVTERIFLYGLIRGFRPERLLEIGSRHGGSASIIAAAMEDVNKGRIVGVDPAPVITVPERAFFGRFQLLRKPSPDGIAEAKAMAGGPFDFALIDGLHIHDQATKDIDGLLPHMADGAYLLFHDAFHYGLSEAIREALERYDTLHDCGYVCAKPATGVGVLAYGGFRMLRVASSRIADPTPFIEHAFRAVHKPIPQSHPDLLNHDAWYCREVSPCPHCVSKRAAAQT